MRVPMKSKPSADDVRRVALAALATALEDRKDEVKKKPGLTGMRAVATGAVIYTAGRAAFTGRRFIRDRFGSDGEPEARDDADEEMVDDEEYDDDEDYDDEPRAEDEEDFEDEDEEEPRAEEDEDYDEEPRAEDEEDFEDEDEDEPRAEDDEDFEDEEEDDQEPRAEEDEDFDDEEEPRAEDEEDFEDEDEDEPRAEDDEDFEDEDEEEDEQPARRAASSRRAPSHPKRESGDAPPVELPRRPSRSRAPIGLS